MLTHNPNNERIKRKYLAYLKEAKRQSEDSVDAAASALARFEADNKFRDFRGFHIEQAIAFKRRISEQDSQTTGEKLSKATLHATFAHLRRFFLWLAEQPGYKSRIRYSDSDYFNLSDKDTRIATARRDKPFPTLEQIKHVIANMPSSSDIERRNRALVAFILLTGARDSAVASMKLKHVDLAAGCVHQDAREVSTKFSKTFTTYFLRAVGDEIRAIVADWVTYLRGAKQWGNDAPLFPATQVAASVARRFEPVGLQREHWSSAAPIRAIFREAFQAAGLPYFNPHSFRKTLVRLGEALCRTPEEFKAWSQNLGHEEVLTTFYSYGAVAPHRQGEIIQGLSIARDATRAKKVARAVLRAIAEADPELGNESALSSGLPDLGAT
jgi:integrase